MNLAQLRTLGFEGSSHIPFSSQYRVRCHNCEALVINGIPTHETGCPEAKHECAGCNEIIPSRQRYCETCRL
jgi:hypothetical protein